MSTLTPATRFPREAGNLEQRLDRLFRTWTDAEVAGAFEDARDEGVNVNDWGIGFLLWREYCRRNKTWVENRVVCGRCGSDNHWTGAH